MYVYQERGFAEVVRNKLLLNGELIFFLLSPPWGSSNCTEIPYNLFAKIKNKNIQN